jgi:hypothetical protein
LEPQIVKRRITFKRGDDGLDALLTMEAGADVSDEVQMDRFGRTLEVAGLPDVIELLT